MATTPLPFPQESTGSVGPAAPLPAGTAVAHLNIERVLHEGPHNVVYLARDPAGQPLALMEYFPRTLALRQPDGSVRARQAGDAIALSVGREAFVVDANTLQRIEHEGIVRVLGSLQAHRTVYRAMTLVEGPTLERHIAARGRAASAGAAVRLLDAVLDALEVLHRSGVVHGCVRPDQILMAAGERPVLLGMGSAGAEIAGHEAGPWSAPEQAAQSRHDRINSATDLYMAGATAWCYATGDTPPTLRERLADPDAWDPSAALDDLPEAPDDVPGTRQRLAVALTVALALLPAERPQRVADLRRLLRPGAKGAFSARPATGAAAADPAFETSGTVPLWVGTMPDRDEQWEVFEKEVAYSRHVPAPATKPASTPTAAQARPKPHAPTRPAPELYDVIVEGDSASGQQRPPRAASRWWWGLPALAVVVAVAAAVAWWARRENEARPLTVSTPPGATAPAPVPVSPGDPALQPVVASPPPPAPVQPVPPQAQPLPPQAQPAPPQAQPAPSTIAPAAPALKAPAAPPAAAAKPKPPAPPSPRSACGNRSQFALLYCLQDQCNKLALRNHPQCAELRRQGDVQ